jgi:hypothetical protein
VLRIPSTDPNLFALDAAGNRPVARSVVGSNSGVAVAGGRVFLGLAHAFEHGLRYDAPGSIVALGPSDGERRTPWRRH